MLYQELYNKGGPIDGARVETVHFTARGRRGLPVNALNNIDNGDELAFPICASIKMKVALRFGVGTRVYFGFPPSRAHQSHNS